MRYYEYRVATYRTHYDNKIIDTRAGWAKKGFVVIRGREGEMMYTNGYLGQTCVYFYESDVRKAPVPAQRYLDKMRAARNKRRRELYRTRVERKYEKIIEGMKRDAVETMRAATAIGGWRGHFKRSPYVLIFDTETTGLSEVNNNILSLSWQLIKINADFFSYDYVERRDFYFEWPENVFRVTSEAIAVNGLTRERLAELGTTDKKIALEQFRRAVAKAGIVVAHNLSFDLQFIESECERNGIDSICWPAFHYCTMKKSTRLCKLFWYEGAREYKWPKLNELAMFLDVPTNDIEFHLSSADVELTKRCFLEIVKNGMDTPW